MSKRIISLILSIAFVCTVQSPILANTWWQESKEIMEDYGYMTGDEKGNFFPEKHITRAEFCSVLVRVAGLSAVSNESFSDVSENAWYNKSILSAVEAGYFSGYNDGLFKPDNYITRAEAASVINRVFAGYSESVAGFGDEIPSWAEEDINAVFENGFMSGYGDGDFGAHKYITRAETAVLFANILENVHCKYEDIVDKSFDGNLIITVDGINVKDVNISGDLYITGNIGVNEITLDNVTANKIVYCSKDGNIVLRNVKAESFIVAGKGNAKIVFTEDTEINNSIIKAKTSLDKLLFTGSVDTLKVLSDINVKADFADIYVKNKCSVVVEDDAVIDSLTVEKDAANTTVDVISGNIKNASLQASIMHNGTVVAAGKTVSNLQEEKTDDKKSYTAENSKPNTGGGSGGGGGGGAGSSSSAQTVVALSNLTLDENTKGELLPRYSTSVNEYDINIGFETDTVSIVPQFDSVFTCYVDDVNVYSGREYVFANISVGENVHGIKLYKNNSIVKEYKITIKRSVEISTDLLMEFDGKIGILNSSDFEACIIYGVEDACMSKYNTALSAARAEKGAILTQAEIQSVVDNVNGSSAILSGIHVSNPNFYTSGQSFCPAMKDNVFDYYVTVENELDKVFVYPEKITINETAKINGREYNEETPYEMNIAVGENTCDIVVTSADESEILTYTLHITRDDKPAKNKNQFFNDELNGYSLSNETYTLKDSILEVGGAGKISTTEYFTLFDGMNLDVSIVAAPDRGRVGVSISIVDKDENAYQIAGGQFTSRRKLEARYVVSNAEPTEYKLVVQYNAAIDIESIQLSYLDTTATLTSVDAGANSTLLSTPIEGNNTYRIKVPDGLTSVNLSVSSECDTLKINDEVCNTKEIILDSVNTRVSVEAIADAGNSVVYTVYLIREYNDSIDVKDATVLSEIIANPSEITVNKLEKLNITDIDEEKLTQYISHIDAFVSSEENVRASDIAEIIDFVNGKNYEAEELVSNCVSSVPGASNKHTTGAGDIMEVSVPVEGIYEVKARVYGTSSDNTKLSVNDEIYDIFAKSQIDENGWRYLTYSVPMLTTANEIRLISSSDFAVDFIEIKANPHTLMASSSGVYPIDVTYQVIDAVDGDNANKLTLSINETDYVINYPTSDGGRYSRTIYVTLEQGINNVKYSSNAVFGELRVAMHRDSSVRLEGEQEIERDGYGGVLNDGYHARPTVANTDGNYPLAFEYWATVSGSHKIKIRYNSYYWKQVTVGVGGQIVATLNGGNYNEIPQYMEREVIVDLTAGRNDIVLQSAVSGSNEFIVDYIEITKN